MSASADTEGSLDRGLVLGIDTCGSSGSAALARLNGTTAEMLGQQELAGRTYSVTLIPTIGGLLAHAGAQFTQIHALVVVNGPGSFTGIRVGVSAAKGLAEGRCIGVVPVSRLEVLAFKAQVLCAALDAYRHELFLRLVRPGQAATELLAGREEFVTLAPQPTRIAFCEDAAECLLRAAWPAAELIRVPAPTAADAIVLCASRVLARQFADLAPLDGHYLRRSDAEIFGEPGAPVRSVLKPRADEIEIRPMTVADLPRILEIAAGLPNSPHWPISAYRNAVDPEEAPARVALVAVALETGAVQTETAPGTIQGFTIASLLAGQGELEIIATSAPFQGRGIGRQLLGRLIDRLRQNGTRELFLEVRASNQPALHLYRAFGFVETSRRSRYYADPIEDGVLMRLVLL